MKQTLLVLTLASSLACSGVEYNFSGDLVSQFTAAGDNTATLVQKAGRAIYQNGETLGDAHRILIWNPVNPRADQSWTVSADLTIPLLATRDLSGPRNDATAGQTHLNCFLGSGV